MDDAHTDAQINQDFHETPMFVCFSIIHTHCHSLLKCWCQHVDMCPPALVKEEKLTVDTHFYFDHLFSCRLTLHFCPWSGTPGGILIRADKLHSDAMCVYWIYICTAATNTQTCAALPPFQLFVLDHICLIQKNQRTRSYTHVKLWGSPDRKSCFDFLPDAFRNSRKFENSQLDFDEKFYHRYKNF